MSKHETPMTRRFWQRVGGTLLEEYTAVYPGPDVSPRWLDAVIIADGEYRIASRKEQRGMSFDGHDVIVVQTKADRLGMYLLGQAFFSRLLVERLFAPRSVRTVALCEADDAVLGPLARDCGIEVVVDELAAEARAERERSRKARRRPVVLAHGVIRLTAPEEPTG